MIAAVIFVPYLAGKFLIPGITIRFLSYGHIFLAIILAPAVIISYWALNSIYASQVTNQVALPNNKQSSYFIFKDAKLSQAYNPDNPGSKRIPMQIWHDAFFEGKIDIKRWSFFTLLSKSFSTIQFSMIADPPTCMNIS
jgi:hypothetical protein